jgi:DNA-binding transcriptional ArsR family regulator
MAEGKRTDQELVKALSHPIRVEILETLQGRVASPVELSREMNESLGVISYHARTLVRCGCLELVETKPQGGSVESFFGVTPGSSVGRQEWRSVPLAVRSGITKAALKSFLEAAVETLKADAVDAGEEDDGTLTWMPLTVDEAGWHEIAEIMQQTSRLVTEAHARSAERLAGEEGTPIIVGLAAFEAERRQATDEDEKG